MLIQSVVCVSLWWKMVFKTPKIASVWGTRSQSSQAKNNRNSYEKAIRTLNSLQTNTETLQKAYDAPREWERIRFEKVGLYLERTGITPDDLDKLSVIHVAGSKGKGSTCAITESILRAHGYKTGFFSSPHLISATERIQISGIPISQKNFVKYFWRVYNALDKKKDNESDMPFYFQILTVMAFHVFLDEKVDVAIVEVGLGGEFDCTNIIRNTKTVGITSLALEHTLLLGSTLAEIAWQKAGIIKNNSNVFTVPQPDGCMDVIEARTLEKNAYLHIVPHFDSYHWRQIPQMNVNTNVQKLNTSLAIQLSYDWMAQNTREFDFSNCNSPSNQILEIGEKVFAGIEKSIWPGRCQIIKLKNKHIFLDGAHTVESIDNCTDWFDESTKLSTNPKCLIFNTSGPRDVKNLLQIIANKLHFDLVIFVPTVSSKEVNLKDNSSILVNQNEAIEQCKRNQSMWQDLMIDLENRKSNYINGQSTVLTISNITKMSEVKVFENITDILRYLDSRFITKSLSVDILVTGSLHLIGATLLALECINAKN